MTRKAKGLGGDNAKARKKAHFTSDNSTADQAAVLELQAMEPPPGCLWITREHAERIRRAINDVINGIPHPEFKILLELEPETVAKGWTALRIFNGQLRIWIVVQRWHPKFRKDAHGLLEAVEAVWQSTVPLDDVAGELEDARYARTLLTDGRRLAAASLRAVDTEIDRVCIPLMETIQSPSNWCNTIPPGTLIEGFYYQVVDDKVK